MQARASGAGFLLMVVQKVTGGRGHARKQCP